MCPHARAVCSFPPRPFFFFLFYSVRWLCVRDGPSLWFSQYRTSARAILYGRWRRSGWQYVHGRVSVSAVPFPPAFELPRVAFVEEKIRLLTVLGARARVHLHSRVALCDYRGNPLLECYVVPTMAVTDYRTSTTGITSANLSSGRSPPQKMAARRFVLQGGRAVCFSDAGTDSAELVCLKPTLSNSKSSSTESPR
jgi:hypothetical protein